MTNDIEQLVELSLAEAYTGTERGFRIQTVSACKKCKGSGSFFSHTCPDCQGAQFMPFEKRIQVSIPAGVDTGTRVRIVGEGLPDANGGPPGDLYLLVTVLRHPDFERRVDDLFTTLEVDQRIAGSGGRVLVRAPDGYRMQLMLPPATAENTSFRLSRKGMPNCQGSERGDLYVRVGFAQPRPQAMPQAASTRQQPQPPPPASTLATGAARVNSLVGNYRLVRLLGSGGFADVYLGEHQYLKTQAAIKVLQGTVNALEVQSFMQEAETVARLAYPNIVRVLEFGLDGASPYLVMDYAPGGTLQDRHSKGVILQVTAVLPYVKQVAAALQHAHKHNLVHRDIKPANMLVGRQGEILLSDFGIAVIAHKTQSLATQEVIGSVSYMAPEQIQGKPRLASDQYSLAIVAYEWLTGKLPFDGSNLVEIALRQISDPPPSMRVRVPGISPAVERVVLKALAKDPHQRFPSVQAFADALGQASRGF
jgi:Protein kinase domain/DnaJ C terminal domain